MLGFAWSHLVRDAKRSLTMVVALVFAVTSFVTLSSASETQRLTTTKTVADNYDVGFDILVRPSSAVSQFEKDNGVVRGGFIGGVYGGMTQAQLDKIRAIPGVEVAAPMAILGVIQTEPAWEMVDVTDMIPPGQEQSLVVAQYVTTSRDGKISVQSGRFYNYVTNVEPTPGKNPHTYGEMINGTWYNTCPLGSDPVNPDKATTTEIANRGSAICWWQGKTHNMPLPSGFNPQPGHKYVLVQSPRASYLAAAIDPEAEATLARLDSAVDSGRYFIPADSQSGGAQFALVSSQTPQLDYQTTLTISVLGDEGVNAWRTTTTSSSDDTKLARYLGNVKPYVAKPAATRTLTFDSTQLYADVLKRNPPTDVLGRSRIFGGDIEDTYPIRAANPAPTLNADGSLSYAYVSGTEKEFPLYGSFTYLDGGVRALTLPTGRGTMRFVPVGTFDPTKVHRGDYKVGEVPLGIYEPNTLTAADETTKQLMKGDRFVSMLNPMDYQQLSPTLLVPWSAISYFDTLNKGWSDAPISAIRIRVAGVTGPDDLSNERLRSVAEQINAIGGVTVDIAAGSSTTTQLIRLPATKSLPATSYTEQWTKKGAAVVVQKAIDAKSLLLATLILASSALTVVISASASVAARRKELAVLSAIGWRGDVIRRSVLTEMGIIGLGSGILGAVVALPVSHAAGITYNGKAALAAIPVVLLLCLLAGGIAAATQARVRPIEALRPAAARIRHTLIPGATPTALGLTSILRRPGRIVLATLAVALAVASLTVLETITTAFRGRITGTVLGEVVTLQVRTPDRIAAWCLAILGLICVTTVLVVGLLEDAHVHATLASIGWNDLRTTWVVAVQGLLLGALGAVFGMGIGLALVRLLAGGVDRGAVSVALSTALWAILAVLAITIIPAMILRRLPLARILSQE